MEDKYIGPTIKMALINYQGFSEDDALEAVKLYREIYIEKYVLDSMAYEGIENVLKHFQKMRIKMKIATMKTMPQVNKLLEIFGFEKYFNGVEAARENGTISKVQMLANIKEKSPAVERFLMVGDTIGDFKAALEVGYEFVAADYGYGEIEKLDCAHIKSTKELIDRIRQ